MKMSLTRIFLLFGLLASNTSSYAAMSDWTVISQIIVHDNKGIIIVLADSASKENCSYSNQVLLDPSHYLFDGFLSTALSSLHTGSQVRFWTYGCLAYGNGTIPKTTRMDVKK